MDHRFSYTDRLPSETDHLSAGAECPSSDPDLSRRAALILAGGRSSRMGADKPLLKIGGETLLERAVRFWRESGRVGRILIANGQPGHLEPLPEGTQAVYDLEEGRGPMAGLIAAFRQSDADVLYVSAVDMPFLRRDAILPVPPGDAAVYHCAGRRQPLFGVYRRSILPKAEAVLAEGCGTLNVLLDRCDTLIADLPDFESSLFSNINTPEDLQRARAGQPPVIAVCGWHNAGKTTFLSRLIPALRARGLRIGLFKHDGHGFDMDKPGTDTYILTEAGADPVSIIGPERYALLGTGVTFPEQLRFLYGDCDLIFAEGFKYSAYPKIEFRRAAVGRPRIVTDDTLVALVTDAPADPETDPDVPGAARIPLDDIEGCADLLCRIFLAK